MFFSFLHLSTKAQTPPLTDNGRQNFRPFLPQGKWMLGRSVGTNLRSSEDRNQVLWLFVQLQHQETYIPKYVAKVFSEYTEKDAQLQLRRYPPRIPKKAKEVKDELDPYTNEARAYHCIEMSCASSERIYYPEFHGVITDLGISRFTYGFINPRAIVLESIRPKLASRRILAAHREDNCEIRDQLNHLRLLSDFELEYYHSLFHDRIRRLLVLHKLGITHGDVRDDHFRLPGDFYDTVLYDFSHSYTFSSVMPYLVNFRPPCSLKTISDYEQTMVKQQIYERAKNLDFRNHLEKSSGLTQAMLMDALFQPLKDEPLELIILRVNFRPDAFSMPSVNSVFPFLEDIRPKDDNTWHIRRGRLLESYESIWISSTTNDSGHTSMSIVSDLDYTENVTGAKRRYLLCLVPKEWGVEDVRSPLTSICSSLPRGARGCIKTCIDLEHYN
ncbi:hypothetical protein DTO164E3_8132 [Paecilomyces variotii]|nr:hypothetical protein DTO164E3_8132 [Paecilomyces variotii]KAJ9226811.1 hypothetical protein DTO169C6_1051 [Paecilomyces variotii]KAJ9327465.1 hypothetical protein DTO027B3_1687 [Paecilomyces variotii]KAJ9334989.1 hypothetical protein DTO027B5_3206 [Paecilomyces variotii]KAJ9406417.1 hypothetical protein DTO045G8_5806 [Paecilomyces variotii]